MYTQDKQAFPPLCKSEVRSHRENHPCTKQILQLYWRTKVSNLSQKQLQIACKEKHIIMSESYHCIDHWFKFQWTFMIHDAPCAAHMIIDRTGHKLANRTINSTSGIGINKHMQTSGLFHSLLQKELCWSQRRCYPLHCNLQRPHSPAWSREVSSSPKHSWSQRKCGMNLTPL